MSMIDPKMEIVLTAKDMTANAFKRLESRMSRMTKSVFSLNGAMVGLAGAAGMGALIKSSLEAGDSIAKTADAIGISTKALQEYRYIAERSGVTTQQLDKGMGAFSKRLGELRAGTGALNTMLNKNNEELKNQLIQAGSTSEALDIYFNALKDVENQSDRNALSAAAFSRTAGIAMTVMVDNVDTLRDRYERLGVTIDDTILRQTEAAKDSIDDLTLVIKNSFTTAVVSMAPELGKAADAMSQWVVSNKEFLTQGVPKTIRSTATEIKELKEIYDSIPDYITGPAGMGLIGTAILGRAPGKVILALSAINELAGMTGNSIQDLVRKHKEAGQALTDLWQSIADAMGWTKEESEQVLHAIDKNTEGFRRYAAGADGAAGSTSNFGETLKTSEQINREYAKSLEEIEIAWMNFDALNLTDKERRMQISDDLYDQTRAILDKQKKDKQDALDAATEAEKKALEDSIREHERAAEKVAREWERTHDDMHEFASDTFYDLFKGTKGGWGGLLDTMEDMWIRSLANMAADAAMTNIFKPLMQSLAGSALGKMFGLPGSSGGDFNIPGLIQIGKLFGFGGGAVNTWSRAPYAAGADPALSPLGPFGMSPGLSNMLGMGTFSALAGLAVSKVFESLTGDKPSLMFRASEQGGYGGYKGALTGVEKGEGGYEMFTQPGGWAAGAKSSLFDYRIGVKDTGQDPEVQQQVFDYFDTIFTGIEETIGNSMNDVLDKHKYLGIRTQLYKGGSIESLSEDVFSDMLGTLLVDLFPDQSTFDKVVSTVTGYKKSTPFDQSYPNAESQYLGKGEYKQKPTGKAFYNDPAIQSIVAPVYEDVAYEVSEAIKTFNEAFFKSITPEGGNEWDAFLQFGNVAKSTEDFMQKFNRQIENFGESTLSAYQNIQTVSTIMAAIDADIANMTAVSTFQQALNDINMAFDEMALTLDAAHATVGELNRAEAARAQLLGAQITGLTGASLQSGIAGGGSISSIIQGSLTQALAGTVADSIVAKYIVPLNEAVGQAWFDSGEDIEAVLAVIDGYDLTGAEKEIAKFRNQIEDLFEGSIALFDKANISALKIEEVQQRTGKGMFSQYRDVWGDYNVNYNANTESGRDNWMRWFRESSSQEITDWINDAGVAGDEFVSMMRDMISLERDLADARSDAKRSIEDLINDLTFSDLAPVTSMGRYRTQYDRLESDIQSATSADEISDAINKFTAFVPDFLQFAAAFGGDYGTVYQEVMSDLKGYGASFDGGGMVSGPKSGYTMPVTFHGTEHISTDSDMKDVKALLTRLVNMSHEGGNVQVVVKVGEREIRDMTFDVIRTDPGTQQQIRRVAHV